MGRILKEFKTRGTGEVDMTTQVQQWLQEMKEVAESILIIDLEEEANDELLLSLQNKQMELRESIEQLVVNNQHSYDEIERQLLDDCLTLERQIERKFRAIQLEASEQLIRISSGKRSRDAYQGEEIRHMGYFIDSNR